MLQWNTIRSKTVPMLALAALVTLAAGGAAEAHDFIPDDSADRWTYRLAGSTVEVTSEIDAVSSGWRRFTRFGGFRDLWVWPGQASNRAWVWNGSSYDLLADFDGAVGSESFINLGCNIGRVRLGAREDVTTAAGTFPSCVRLDFRASCADAGVGAMWFARGVGVVKWTEQSISGPRTYELVRGSIGGTTYPRPTGGLGVCIESNLTRGVIQLRPGTGAGPELRLELTLRNDTGRNVTFAFRDGQSFEIELIDGTGAVVRKWSDGRFFTMATWTRTVADGDSWTLTGTMDLKGGGASGAGVVPAGTYTARMSVEASPRLSGEVGLEVVHVMP